MLRFRDHGFSLNTPLVRPELYRIYKNQLLVNIRADDAVEPVTKS